MVGNALHNDHPTRAGKPVREGWLLVLALLGCSALDSGAARAQAPVQPWEQVGNSLATIYGWPGLLFHVAAIAVTPPLVYTLDEPAQQSLRPEGRVAHPFSRATYALGFGMPVVVPFGVYFVGLAGHEAELASAGAAAIQACLFDFIAVTTLKWITGRAGPDVTNNSRAFRFNPLAFDANPLDPGGDPRWPSGHTSTNFALVSALFGFYPDHAWIAAIGYPVALSIGFGMVQGHYHWLSDVVAGALMGHVIGWSVGRRFRRAFELRKIPRDAAIGQPASSAFRIELAPVAVGYSSMGLGVMASF
jgi:membrane-associated phospholipid phosphatase